MFFTLCSPQFRKHFSDISLPGNTEASSSTNRDSSGTLLNSAPAASSLDSLRSADKTRSNHLNSVTFLPSSPPRPTLCHITFVFLPVFANIQSNCSAYSTYHEDSHGEGFHLACSFAERVGPKEGPISMSRILPICADVRLRCV